MQLSKNGKWFFPTKAVAISREGRRGLSIKRNMDGTFVFAQTVQEGSLRDHREQMSHRQIAPSHAPTTFFLISGFPVAISNLPFLDRWRWDICSFCIIPYRFWTHSHLFPFDTESSVNFIFFDRCWQVFEWLDV